MIKEYYRPENAIDALTLLKEKKGTAIAGGTAVMAFNAKYASPVIIDLCKVIPKAIEQKDGMLSIGAGCSFQEIVDNQLVPFAVKKAALSMANRNNRNRATIGGNVALSESSSSLVPLLLVLEAKLEITIDGKSTKIIPISEYPSLKSDNYKTSENGIIYNILIPLPENGKSLFVNTCVLARTKTDINTASSACSYSLVDGKITNLRLAIGCNGPKPELRKDIASLFEGKTLPINNDLEKQVLPLLSPIADIRGGVAYKKQRLSVVITDVVSKAEAYK